MKRVLWAVILVVLLSGCAQNVEPDTIPTTQETTVPAETSCYIEESKVEQSTDGAVKVYDLPDSSYVWMEVCNDRVLLTSTGEQLKLVQGSGSGETFMLDEAFMENIKAEGYRQSTLAGVAIYDEAEHQVVFVRPGLQQYVVEVPEFEGTPVFSPDGNSMYYCQGAEIRVTDLNTGIDRMLKSQTCESQELIGIYFDGTLLGCRVIGVNGEETTDFISAQTGQTVQSVTGLKDMKTFGSRFAASYMDGTVLQCLFGEKGGTPLNLRLPDSCEVLATPELGGMIVYEVSDNHDLVLDFYDFSSGKRLYSVTISGADAPKSLRADGKMNCLWVLAKDAESGEDSLFQWSLSGKSTADESIYTEPYYTADSPDTERLRALEDLAEEISDKHSVDIRIWEAAVKKSGSYLLVPEYQPKAIEEALTALDVAMGQYPDKFFYKSVIRSLKICVVRSVDGGNNAVYHTENADVYVIIPVGCDYEDSLARMLGYVVDIHVLSNCSVFDDWGNLNPEGFTYGQTPDTSLLEGETRAFADEQCAASVVDDRSLLFYYAVRPGNEDIFTSDIMQKKLQKLCVGVRTAWRWKNVKEAYPWEQYLNESIAPT